MSETRKKDVVVEERMRERKRTLLSSLFPYHIYGLREKDSNDKNSKLNRGHKLPTIKRDFFLRPLCGRYRGPPAYEF